MVGSPFDLGGIARRGRGSRNLPLDATSIAGAGDESGGLSTEMSGHSPRLARSSIPRRGRMSSTGFASSSLKSCARCGSVQPRRAPIRSPLRPRPGSPEAAATASWRLRCAPSRAGIRRWRSTFTSVFRTQRMRSGCERASTCGPPPARAVGQLAVLPGRRQWIRLAAHDDLPGFPAHRYTATI